MEGRSKIAVASWPPPEFEEQEQQNVQLLQTSFSRQRHSHAWPPTKPGEEPQEVGEEPGTSIYWSVYLYGLVPQWA